MKKLLHNILFPRVHETACSGVSMSADANAACSGVSVSADANARPMKAPRVPMDPAVIDTPLQAFPRLTCSLKLIASLILHRRSGFLPALLTVFGLLSLPAPAQSVDWNTETIHCGNLIYGNNQTSVCFAETFLTDAANATGLNIHPKFSRIALAKEEVFNTPMCIFTGEGDFVLKESERANLRRYLENGGFIFSSPGCSNAAWNKAFAREIALDLPGYELREIPMDHELFSTVHKIPSLTVRGRSVLLQGIIINGRLALVHSPEGLNNAANAKGCCCCGGAEISQAREVNVNAVAYALLH